MDIDPGCTFASLSVSAKNQHIVATLRDALSGLYPWPVLVRASDPGIAMSLLHAAANHARGELSRSIHVEKTAILGRTAPSWRRRGFDAALPEADVLLISGIDPSPITTEAIIVLAQAMDATHAKKRPVITFASLSNDIADGHLVQLTTRYAGGRPLTWTASTSRKPRDARTEQRAR